jgi:MOSC domain-containing protein YiiM
MLCYHLSMACYAHSAIVDLYRKRTEHHIMRVVSVNVGLPRAVPWKHKTVTTSIFKEPVTGPVRVRQINLDGDRQADLSVHGGPDKAVYTYSADNYPWWREEYPDLDLPFGMFGENLTIEGLDEAAIYLGDRYRVGTVELIARQPRFPCYKLGIRFGRDDILKRFLASGLSGVYFVVAQAGDVQTGDDVELLARDPQGVSIADWVRLYRDKSDTRKLRELVTHPYLMDEWRGYFLERMAKARDGLATAGK